MIIYMSTNKINGKMYIGQTINSLERRRGVHISKALITKDNSYFHNAIRKYGTKNFSWEIIDTCDDRTKLNLLEVFYIGYYNTFVGKGYNLNAGGNGNVGFSPSAETREKLSKMRRGVKKSPEHIKSVARAKSQYWEIIYPDGNKEIIRNLSAFCRKHNISDRGMWLVANNYRTHHKKFKCKKIV